MVLSKTDYLVYRECKKNAWLRKNNPEIYFQFELSAFEKMIIQAGNTVEIVARGLFSSGVLIEGRDKEAQAQTLEHIKKGQSVLFQAIFEKDGFLAAIDILEFNPETNGYSIYEVKSTNEIDEKIHYYDLAFQVNLLRKCGLNVEKINLLHLNKEYVRIGSLDTESLFVIEDITEIIESLLEEVEIEMEGALNYISQESLPEGFCICVYKGRSNHCTCFAILNPEIPEYSVHDIARIGSSKKKLEELVDSRIFNVHEVPPHIKLSTIQQNQVDAHKSEQVLLNKEMITKELQSLQFPLHFIDYETLLCAIPRFNRFSPNQQVPFQYSLHILNTPDDDPQQFDFLHTELDDPSNPFVASLRENIGDKGSVIVWNKPFECGRNKELATRVPEMREFLDSLNDRVYDLMDIFKKQYYVHKGFRGSTSIKKVLPVLVPSLTYKELGIQDGGSASEIWNKYTTEDLNENERMKIVQDLKEYCGMDTYAMYAIWKELLKLVNAI